MDIWFWCLIGILIIALYFLVRWKSQNKFIKFLRVLLFVLDLAVIAVGIFIYWFTYSMEGRYNPPNDKKIIAIFQQHRPEFEKLLQMAAEDKQQGKCFTKFYSGTLTAVDQSRGLEYKTLLNKIYPGLDLGPGNSNDFKGLQFVFAYSGCAICDDHEKGIEYISGNMWAAGKASQNLDKVDGLPPGDYIRRIEPQWFLYYHYYQE